MPPNNKSWNEYRRYVVEKLETHSENFEGVFERLNRIDIAIATLKTKAGIFGLIGGSIPVLIMLAIIIIRWQLQQ